MAQLHAEPGQDREFWNGVFNALRWAIFAGFGLLGLIGASSAPDPTDSARDLGIFVVVVLLSFWEIKRHYDGAPAPGFRDLVIEDPLTLAVGLPILLALGLAGLFMASEAETMSGYYAGLGLAIGSAGMAFFSVKARFDAEEAGRDQ
jgi:hypothetical protein